MSAKSASPAGIRRFTVNIEPHAPYGFFKKKKGVRYWKSDVNTPSLTTRRPVDRFLTKPLSRSRSNVPKIISIVGTSNSGKTTLIVKLITELKKRGYRIGTIKHTHHPVPLGPDCKDSGRHKGAGADTVILAGAGQISMIKDCPTEDPGLLENHFSDADIILTEGYKRGPYPKLEVHREETGAPILFPDKENALFAFASNGAAHPSVPSFSLEDAQGIVDLIERLFLRPTTELPPSSK
jgi:molybdopterin-guanine dinucleotide biosynthesis adapter protein